jgi:protein-L-isoaspartate(D-aspartate) O-methyltransferase
MVELQLAGRGIDDERILAAVAAVERERFCGVDHADDAYADCEIPIGYGQVLQRPETVGRALDLLALRGDEKLLVVGAGSGYVAAVAVRLVREVIATERVAQLAARAARNLGTSARVLVADGTQGLARHAPYDAALVLAVGTRAPQRVLHELTPGGRLVHLDEAGAAVRTDSPTG